MTARVRLTTVVEDCTATSDLTTFSPAVPTAGLDRENALSVLLRKAMDPRVIRGVPIAMRSNLRQTRRCQPQNTAIRSPIQS